MVNFLLVWDCVFKGSDIQGIVFDELRKKFYKIISHDGWSVSLIELHGSDHTSDFNLNLNRQATCGYGQMPLSEARFYGF